MAAVRGKKGSRVLLSIRRRMWVMYQKARARVARSASARRIYRRLSGHVRRVGWRLRALKNIFVSLTYSKQDEFKIIEASGLFDIEFYVARYGKYLQSGEHPIAHFLREGVNADFSPSSLFHTRWYKQHSADIVAAGINPLVHYALHGGFEGRKPSAMFDSRWYLESYEDVRMTGLNPLLHFIKFGYKEGRDPSPLFSMHWYTHEYRDVANAGINPLQHYIEVGAYEGRDPNPYFNSAWYLARNPEVARSGQNPLEHYIETGWREGRLPGPNFNSVRYLSDYSDVAEAGLDPLQHYLRTGRSEQRRQPIHMSLLSEIMPAVRVLQQTPARPVVDVIIPVYRGLDETRRCIDSVYTSHVTVQFRVVVINDCSPEPAMYEYLEGEAERLGFTYLVNEKNLGFVGTVNRAMALSSTNDVLLLNSDAEVTGDWLDRIVTQVYAAPDIGTATPLSNNATICSYPDFSGRRTLSPGVSLSEMDAACAVANPGRAVDVPTGVGFCMYIRRACLDDAGFFDEEAFGKGYGEENDFCMTAKSMGWRSILALDTFVYHAGEVSFQAGSVVGKQRGMDALLAKHPDYTRAVASHIAEDPAKSARVAVTAQLWRGAGAPVVLLVTHGLGGGTERHVLEIANTYMQSSKVLIMRPASTFAGGGILLQSIDAYDEFSIALDVTQGEQVSQIFQLFNVERIHIHHLYGYGPELERAIRTSGIPFDFTVHDYYTVCPQINLSKDGVRYCGEPDAAGCNACIRARPPFDARDIRSWRMANSWVLRDAQRVIAPSIDAAKRIARYEPSANVLSIYHETRQPDWREIRLPVLSGTEAMRVAVIGVLAPHKGRQLVIDAAIEAASEDALVEFIVVGDSAGSLPPRNLAAIRTTGRYQEEDLLDILGEVDPHVVLFASQWPETYSYTLTAAFLSKRPIIAPNLGAFPERVAGRPWTFEFDWQSTGSDLLSRLLDIRRENIEPGLPPEVHPATLAAPLVLEAPAAYADRSRDLRSIETGEAVNDPQRPLRVSVILEYQGDVPSPCASIRLMTFFDELTRQNLARVRYVSPAEVFKVPADVIVTHRAAVGDVQTAEQIISWARSENIPVVYDLDDNLYDLDPRAEGGKYGALLGVVKTFVVAADEIWASTEVLATRLRAAGAKHVVVHGNHLDPGVWGPAPILPDARTEAPVRILYMGTRTHGDDFAMVDPALRRIKSMHGDDVEIFLIGVSAEESIETHLNYLTPPAVVGSSYPAFVSWMKSLPPFDIGISPLRMNVFNTSKSNIKLLDYSALGLVPVVSNIEPYKEVRDEVDGVLVNDSVKDWVSAITRLINDADLRDRIRRTAALRNNPKQFLAGVRDRARSLSQLSLRERS